MMASNLPRKIMVLFSISFILTSSIIIVYLNQTTSKKTKLALSVEKTWGSFDVAEDVCSSEDGIYVVGWKFDRERQTSVACLAKFDKEGTMIWNATWTDDQGAHARSVSYRNNSIYVLGTISNETYLTQGTVYTHLKKFDKNGKQLWSKSWKTETGLKTSSVHATDEAIYFILNGRLVKLDNNGNKLWERKLNGRAVDLDISLDRIYVAGSTKEDATGGSDAFLAAFDLDGNQLWYTKRESERGDIATRVCATPSAIYIIGTGGKGYDLRFITKFDIDGNQQWDRKDATYLDLANYDGRLYAVGSLNDDALVAQLDHEGRVTWNATLGKPGREDYAAGVCVDENGIYVVGTTESYTKWADRIAFLLIYRPT